MAYERVYTVSDYWEGPRAGIADVQGVPHAYQCIWDDAAQAWTEQYSLKPVDDLTLAYALEHWTIWRRWEDGFFRGTEDMDTHPQGHHERYDYLEAELARLTKLSADAPLRATADFQPHEGQEKLPEGMMRQLRVEWRITAGTLAPAAPELPLWEVRAADMDDAAEIARLAGEWGHEASADEMRKRLAEMLPDHRQHIAVAAGPRGLLGWVTVERRMMLETGARAELTGLVVDTEARRGGIGRALVAAAQDWAADLGLEVMIVRSNVAREESHPFYEGIGYVRSKTQHVYVKPLRK